MTSGLLGPPDIKALCKQLKVVNVSRGVGVTQEFGKKKKKRRKRFLSLPLAEVRRQGRPGRSLDREVKLYWLFLVVAVRVTGQSLRHGGCSEEAGRPPGRSVAAHVSV